VPNVSFVKTTNGEIVVLLKTHVGWKGNYEGISYSTRPLSAKNIQKDYYGRQIVAIPGIDATSPVIERSVNPQCFLVYFDLN
jgi:hypothetical protein